MGIKSFILRITPDKAREFMGKNIEDNRSIRPGNIDQLAGMIERGEWKVTHQGIAFDTNGNLIDGQHRLLAIIKANKAVDMMVTTGLDPDTFKVLDSGRTRTFYDRLRLIEDSNGNKIACTVARSYVFATGTKGRLPTSDMVEHAFAGMPHAFAAVADGFRKHVTNVTRGTVGAAIATYIHVHPIKGREFLQEVCSGEDLEAGSPALVLRELLRNSAVRNQFDQYWKTVRATQHHFHGEKVKRLNPATADWVGNVYATYLNAQQRKGYKSGQTRKANIKKMEGTDNAA